MIILGTGGHAIVVLEALVQTGREILGFVTPNKEKGSMFIDYSVLGDDDVITTFSPQNVVLGNGIGALPYKKLRWQLAGRLREQGYNFTKVIHPSVVIARDVELAEGVQVMAGSVIQPGSSIGKDSIINTGVLLDHDCKIEQNCHLAPGVVCSGGVNIGEGTHVGTGTSVIQNISIGENCVVAAGSAIYQDVPNNVSLIQERYTRLEKNGI